MQFLDVYDINTTDNKGITNRIYIKLIFYPLIYFNIFYIFNIFYYLFYTENTIFFHHAVIQIQQVVLHRQLRKEENLQSQMKLVKPEIIFGKQLPDQCNLYQKIKKQKMV